MPNENKTAENDEVARQQAPDKHDREVSLYQRQREADRMHEWSGGRVNGGGTWAGRER
jgi:hypothetical protein